MKTTPLTIASIEPAVPISLSQLSQWLSPAEIEAGEQRGKATLRGPWQICTGYRALCVQTLWDETARANGFSWTIGVTIYGIRSMSGVRQNGYELEGYVSIGGRKVSAFTSSQLFQVIETGKLVSVATIFPRVR